MATRVACSGLRGMENGDAVRDDAAERISESEGQRVRRVWPASRQLEPTRRFWHQFWQFLREAIAPIKPSFTSASASAVRDFQHVMKHGSTKLSSLKLYKRVQTCFLHGHGPAAWAHRHRRQRRRHDPVRAESLCMVRLVLPQPRRGVAPPVAPQVYTFDSDRKHFGFHTGHAVHSKPCVFQH